MKLNNWTVGLAAVGAISLSSAVQAEEKSMVETAVSGTTLSGYVSTSFRYNMNTANNGEHGADALGGYKGNGFNLDVVNLTIEKPLDETEWAAGYKAEFLFGPDAAAIGTSLGSDVTFGWNRCLRWVGLRDQAGVCERAHAGGQRDRVEDGCV